MQSETIEESSVRYNFYYVEDDGACVKDIFLQLSKFVFLGHNSSYGAISNSILLKSEGDFDL